MIIKQNYIYQHRHSKNNKKIQLKEIINMKKQLFCDFRHFNALYKTIQNMLLINKKNGVNIIYTKRIPIYFPNSPTAIDGPGKSFKVLFKKVNPKIIQINKYTIKEVKTPCRYESFPFI